MAELQVREVPQLKLTLEEFLNPLREIYKEFGFEVENIDVENISIDLTSTLERYLNQDTGPFSHRYPYFVEEEGEEVVRRVEGSKELAGWGKLTSELAFGIFYIPEHGLNIWGGNLWDGVMVWSGPKRGFPMIRERLGEGLELQERLTEELRKESDEEYIQNPNLGMRYLIPAGEIRGDIEPTTIMPYFGARLK